MSLMSTTGDSPLSDRTDATFVDAVADLMRSRRMSVRALARSAGASPSHVSRTLRGAQGKQPSIALIERFAEALEVAPDFFVEVRCSRVRAQLDSDPALVDELYDRRQRPPGLQRDG